jgi:hypothetical protein
VRVAYEVLNSLDADFVNIHNGFNFDFRQMAYAGAMGHDIESTFIHSALVVERECDRVREAVLVVGLAHVVLKVVEAVLVRCRRTS